MNKSPLQTHGWRPDDVCITPLGRKALIIRLRLDGKLDARYLGADKSFDGSVILSPETLRRVPKL